MALSSIQLCHIDPVNRAEGKFAVTCNSDNGKQLVVFKCSSESDAIALRNAIRDHADELSRVADYRDDARPHAPRTPAERDAHLEDVAMQLAQAHTEIRRLTRVEKAYVALSDAHAGALDLLQRGVRAASNAINQR